MKTRRILLVCCAGVCLAWNAAFADVIKGVVTDTLSGAGVIRVLVQEKGTANQTLTDAAGRFTLNVTAGLDDQERARELKQWSRYGHLNGEWRLYALDGAVAAHRTDISPCALSGLADGMYLLEMTADGCQYQGTVVVVNHNALVSFKAGRGEPRPKAAAGEVTLMCSRTGYVGKELAATAGDTGLAVKLRTTYPATPAEIGPSNPGALRSSGTIEVATNGTVVENVHVTGYIHIRDGASNVTVRNFKISGNTYWGIYIREGSSTNILIEDGEIDGQNQGEDGIVGSNYTARRVYIHNMAGDGFKCFGNSLIERCYVTAVGQGAGAHGDGVQGPWSAGNYPEIRIINNNFLLNSGSLTACIFTCEYVSHVQVEGNRLSGGSYTIYCSANHTTVNNVFGRDGYYGHRTGDCGAWSGNIWFDTGQPVP